MARPNPWRIASISVLAVTVVLFSLWWAFLRAPGPAEICEHIIQVTLREAANTQMSPQSQERLVETTREQCIQHKQDKLLLRGRIKYAQYAKCVMEAEDLIEIGRC
ncbi:MAG: hypothetical protein H6712_18685 [Myxococcales bacterium]|nr:hypothetical protein [Myxococcales bacterium]MCB9715901.1 hypothetical protein [Myxococcales bacterium]